MLWAPGFLSFLSLITQVSFFNVDKLSAVSLFTLSFNCIALVINLFLVHLSHISYNLNRCNTYSYWSQGNVDMMIFLIGAILRINKRKKTIIQLTFVGSLVFEMSSFTDPSLNKTNNSRSYILLKYTQESCINVLLII